jgi:hypothetical protein
LELPPLPMEVRTTAASMHPECAFRTVSGSAAHIEKRCSCYQVGSSEGDREGATLRQGAREAWAAFSRERYRLEHRSIYAWVSEDEHGSGMIGIKQGLVPAGMIPLVAMDYDLEKLRKLKPQMEAQAATYGKKIRLVRFRFDGVIDETEHGK